jgi:D-sedoheptulose 7-phosphate isomerase
MLRSNTRIEEILRSLQDAQQHVPYDALGDAAELIVKAVRDGRHVWIAGNGGSAATAVHLTSDLVNKCADIPNLQMRVSCLSGNSCLLTALVNDHGWDNVYSAQLAQCATPDDIFLVISVLGGSRHRKDLQQSKNLALGLQTASKQGCRTIGIIGAGGGSFSRYCDVLVATKYSDASVVEPLHSLISHILVELIVNRIRTELIPTEVGEDRNEELINSSSRSNVGGAQFGF